jgi:hypothetical protein
VIYEDLITRTEGKLQIVTLNRPDVLNALQENTFAELRARKLSPKKGDQHSEGSNTQQ